MAVRRWRRFAAWALVLVALLAVVALLFARSTRALEWAAARLSSSVAQAGATLEFQGLSGSLFTTIRAERIDFAQDGGTRARLAGVEIDPSLAALWNRQLVLDRITIAELDVELVPSDEPLAEPAGLALPIEVQVGRATVGRLRLQNGDTRVELLELAAGYRGGPRRHEIEALSLRIPGLLGPSPAEVISLSMTGGIDAVAPYALNGRLRASAESLGAVEVGVGGRLGQLELDGSVTGSGDQSWLRARVTATVAPFIPEWLPRLRIEADGIDAASVARGAPGTALDLRIDASAARDRPVTGRLSATNRLAGPIGANRVPVSRFDAGFEIDPVARRTTLAPLRANLSGGGVLSGRGVISLPAASTGRDSSAAAGLTSDWQLEVSGLDLQAIDTRMAPTLLSGRVRATVAPERQRFDVALDQRDLRLEVVGQRAGPEVLLDRVLVRAGRAAGAGEASGRGRLRLDGEQSFEAELQLRAFDPSVLLAQALPAPAKAPVPARRAGPGAPAPGAAPAAAAASGAAVSPVASGLPSLPPASLNATIAARGRLAPDWQVRVDATVAPSRIALAVPTAAEPSPRVLPVQGRLRGLFSPARADEADILLAVGRNTLRLTGSAGASASVLDLTFDGSDLAQLLPGLGGTLNVGARLSGRLAAPSGKFNLKGAKLSWDGASIGQVTAGGDFDLSTAAPRFDVAFEARTLMIAGQTVSQAGGRLAGSPEQHTLSLNAKAADIDASVVLEGGLPPAPAVARPATPAAAAVKPGSVAVSSWRDRARWRGRLLEARSQGRFPARLASPAALELSPDRVELAPAQVVGPEGRIQIDQLRWEPGRLSTRGSLSGFPAGGLVDMLAAPAPAGDPTAGKGTAAAKAAAKGASTAAATAASTAASPAPAYDSTLRIGGQWSLTSSPRWNGTIALRREDGDVALRAGTPFPLGLTRVDLDARFIEDRLQAKATVAGKALGEVTASLVLEPAPGLSLASPMTLRADLAIRSLRPFERLVGAFADIDGTISASVEGTGTLAKPAITGTLRAERLRMDAPQLGISLRDGRIDARLANGVLEVATIEVSSGQGRFTAKGSVPLRTGAIAPALAWRADRFTALSRPDQRIVVDGDGTLSAERGRLLLAGRLAVREGYIEFGTATRSGLGDDVVIVGRLDSRQARARPAASPLALRLDIDMGKSFRVIGSGLDAYLSGQVALRSTEQGALTASGSIRTERGTFSAFGQRLEITRGQLVFNGPVDNPGIDALALRRLPSVEVGVEITGTVRAPLVRTTSNPPMAQGEQLSWLVLGRSLDSASQGDAAMIAGVAASMLGGNGAGVPVTRRIAQAFGVDEVGVRGSNTIEGQVFTVGKRLSDRIYIAYEQAVTAATNLVRIELELHRFVSVRVEAGAVSFFGINFTRSLR